MQAEGVKVSGSGITISKTAVRGVDSFGMLCSAHDIGWSSEADGVLVIMPDDAQPGDPCPADAPKVTRRQFNACTNNDVLLGCEFDGPAVYLLGAACQHSHISEALS